MTSRNSVKNNKGLVFLEFSTSEKKCTAATEMKISDCGIDSRRVSFIYTIIYTYVVGTVMHVRAYVLYANTPPSSLEATWLRAKNDIDKKARNRS